ncbi:hypothetical protein M378DRAFT_15286 [Amanita muscaria Koide BX008]|uniref:Uncharacterized protein n=1 Tax=Amanita muscaria (strain Koide BX008) TaxID=946122 RepID=A0A0C2WR18_AMAMK|nr:hypothetical protein M378DRAFT_15286 [Amanita muscaria Koide BX008]
MSLSPRRYCPFQLTAKFGGVSLVPGNEGIVANYSKSSLQSISLLIVNELMADKLSH